MATETLSVKITAKAESFSKALDKMNDDISKVTKNFDGLNKLGDTFKNVGAKMTLVGAGIVGSMGLIVSKGAEWTAQVESTDFLYKNLDKTVQKAIESNSKNAKAIGLTAQQYKNGATSISTYFKNMGLTATETANLSGKTMDLVADLGAVADVPFDEALRDFKSALMGNYEAVDKYGISLSASSLENSEFVKSLGKSWNQLSDNEKMMAAYNEVTRQSSSAQGLAKQEAESFGMKFKYLKQQIGETVGQIGSALLPVLEPLVKKFSEVAEKVAGWVKENPKLTQAILMVVGIIGVLLATLGPLLIVMGSCITIFTGLTVAAAGLGIGVLPLIGIIAGVIAAITGLIAAGVWLYQNWDTVKAKAKELGENLKNSFIEMKDNVVNRIKEMKDNVINWFTQMKDSVVNKANELKTNAINKFNELKTNAINKFNEMKEGLSNKVQEAKQRVIDKFNQMKTEAQSKCENIINACKEKFNEAKQKFVEPIQNALNTIKNALTSFKPSWSIPKPKLPKIDVSMGSKSILGVDIPYPKFSVSWNAKGGIFRKPTIFNTPAGLQGVGEAGAEAIIPLKSFYNHLDDKLDSMGNGGISITVNANVNNDMDIRKLADDLAYHIKRKNIAIGR